MDFCFLQLVGVWISNCDALLVTVCCCYIIKVNVLITKFDGGVMKNMDSLMLRANTIEVNFPLAKARRFQLDHPMYANSRRWTLSMGRPACWYLWLQAVAVIWRGNVKPYWCLVSKCSLSGWKLLGKLRSYRFVPCGLGGSFQCWCCVCVLDMLLVVCWLGIVSNAKNHTVPCCRATRSWLHSNNEKKTWRCPDDCDNIYFWARRLLSETKSETQIAIRDKTRNKIGIMDEGRQIGFDNINNVNTCEA